MSTSRLTLVEHLSISTAVEKLQRAMFATLPRAHDVAETKKLFRSPRLSVTSGMQLEAAKERIRSAAARGQIAIYARKSASEIALIPPEAVEAILPIRKGLPDALTRIAQGKHRLDLVPFLGCSLMIQANQLTTWMAAERRKLKWPSQEHSIQRPRGRPRLKWKNQIANIIEEMDGPFTFAAIARRLSTDHPPGPSEDTVARICNRLSLETGNRVYAGSQRRSRKIQRGAPKKSDA